MNRICLFFLLSLLVLGCKQKKKPSLSGDDVVEIRDFMEAFGKPLTSFECTDTIFSRKDNDSARISQKVFSQFIPDTVLSKIFGKTGKPKIFPVARMKVPEKESYLLVKAMSGTKKVLLICCFDQQNSFTASMTLLQPDNLKNTEQVSGIDRRFSVYRNITRTEKDGSSSEGKEVYAYSEENRSFILIMLDQLDEQPSEVINPIDTLPKKNKYSADYVRDKMNIVSIRDAGRPGRVLFFIHFQQTKNDCSGEIRGEARFISATRALYHVPGDMCQLEFDFSSTSVRLKEVAPCGNYRGAKCTLDATYPKKRTPKTTARRK